MTGAADAWRVVQLAELVRRNDDLLLQALRVLDPDARNDMPDDGSWVLSGEDVESLRTCLTEGAEIAERIRMLVERVPHEGVIATYVDVRTGAADALADGVLDPAGAVMAAGALDITVGWEALADSLASTDVRSAWTELTLGDLLCAFRGADKRLVRSVLAGIALSPESAFAALSVEAILRLASTLRLYARSC